MGSAGAALLVLLAQPVAGAVAGPAPATRTDATHDATPARPRSPETPAPSSARASTPSPALPDAATTTTAAATASAEDDPTAAAPMRVALRDPFADPMPRSGARWISPDLIDPFVRPASRTATTSQDLRDPFAPLPNATVGATSCRVRPDGLVVQRPRVLRASAPACPPSDPALRDPFVSPVPAASREPARDAPRRAPASPRS